MPIAYRPIGRSYTHTQSVPAQVWTVVHNLGQQYPAITLSDSLDRIFASEVEFVDINTLKVYLSASTTGKVICYGL